LKTLTFGKLSAIKKPNVKSQDLAQEVEPIRKIIDIEAEMDGFDPQCKASGAFRIWGGWVPAITPLMVSRLDACRTISLSPQ
jgi:hypothetical protein